MLRAVLFAWGQTLVDFRDDEELVDNSGADVSPVERNDLAPPRVLGATTHALLEALRNRGLKLGLVSNASDPPSILHRDLERLGLAERLDFAVFASEVGSLKPDP